MDNQPQNTSVSNSSPEQKSASSKLALAMTVEVLAFLLIFFIFLGVLNYFNILRLDPAFPFLSFLPHLPRTGQQVAFNHAPNPTRAPLPSDTQTFTYDAAKGLNALHQYLSEILLPTLQPSGDIKPNQGLSTNVISLSWQSPSPAFNGLGTVEFTLGTNNLSRLSTQISPTALPSQDTLTQAIIEPLFPTYYQNLPKLSDWSCKSLSDKVSMCEQFKDEGDKKEGYGAALNKKITQQNPQPVFFLYTCRFFKADPLYAQRTSCVQLAPPKK